MRRPLAATTTALAPTLAGLGAADRAVRIFKRFDAGGGCRITPVEVGSARDAWFGRIDATGVRRIALDEMTRASHAPTDERLAKRFERPDVNGDGAVARAAFAGRTSSRLQCFDPDGDGAATRREVEGGMRSGG